MTAPDPHIVTLGCRLNLAESEALRAINTGSGRVIINSCAVTAGAVAESRAATRRARQAHPRAELVVTGCAATLDPAGFAAMPEVDGVIENARKTDPAAWRVAEGGRLPRVLGTAPHLAHGFAEHVRAFVEVQNGCDHRCTFCIIPLARGDSRSVPQADVVDHVARAVAAGHAEIVLTGVDLTSYGADLPGTPGLGALVEAILGGVPALQRLRLSSLDSIEIDDHLFALITQEPRVMPHVHLSLQAGDDLILKRMHRRHARADAVRIVSRMKARRPEIAIGADLIAGFPTESAAAFANTRALIDDCDIVHAHVFPYSPRPGTPAARMPQVPGAAIKERAAELRAAAATRRAAWLARHVGSVRDVLVERPGTRGHAPDFCQVRLSGPAPIGKVLPFTISGVDGDALIAATPMEAAA